ncbi:uncharacterized protein LOC113447187 [Pseudonaja textilis]|uniref:uncharacterized protein LOC113447187 n=1 Tax=Pseudonaja textilis TaxID=8673 RepID=UPI000EA84183|nr:uncharacterized protein LOC113447187 [Pseudonaja textilis]
MGKFLLASSIVILFILLQTEEIVSISKKGSSRLSSSSSRKPSRKPSHHPSKPSHHPSKPSHHPVKPAERPRKPAQNPPEHRPAHNAPPNRPENPVKHPPNHANPPPHPHHNPANPQNPGHPPPYPVNPQNPAHPPPYPVNPQNPGHPPPYPVNPQYPAHPPPYPGKPPNPAHPPPYAANPQNPGYFPHQPYNPQNPQWGHYNPKPWKPKSPKTKMKHVAGAAIAGAAAGALGGYFLGRAMSNLHFQFNNPNEERWWYENRHRYSDQVYYPQYIQPVPQDIFVRDCVNITVKEYIEPTGNTTEDEMEARVVEHVVKEMCIEQYRTFSSSSGDSSRPHGGNPVDPKPKDDEVKYVVGVPVVDVSAEDPESYILGSPIAKMYFYFNNSEEERWWNENRHRFATHVYHPNSSQPISRDVFLSECVNVTMGEYVKPTGNQTEDELEARVVTQVANGKCMEMYPRLTVFTMSGSYYYNKPETATTLEIKSEFKHGEGAVLANSPRGVSEHNAPNNAVSDLNFSFENVLFLIHPFSISIITLITPFLIF